MNRFDNALLLAGVLGLIGVGAGAFGAHGLAGRVPDDALQWWKTGAHYAQLHSVALLAVAVAPLRSTPRRIAVIGFSVGAVLFSGSLLAMTLGAPRWFGAITPLGGLALLCGWVGVIAAAHGYCRDHSP